MSRFQYIEKNIQFLAFFIYAITCNVKYDIYFELKNMKGGHFVLRLAYRMTL